MSSTPIRIAVTGASGRLGRALVEGGEHRNWAMVPWSRPELDLDAADRIEILLERDRPDLVIHAAAWTDVDACARDPRLAMARNGVATGVIARNCAERGVGLAFISTNEVFDGERSDGRGYTEDDGPRPGNPYGAGKLAGEEAARAAFQGRSGLWIVRVAWLFGEPGGDFPTRLVSAADRLPPNEAIRLVEDEVGNPTFIGDLAPALLALLDATPGGIWHLVAAPAASRAEWGRAVLDQVRPERRSRLVPHSSYVRVSASPRFGALDPGRVAALGIGLRPWPEALAEYLGNASR